MTNPTTNRTGPASVAGLLRAIRVLIACYAGLSALTLVAAAVLVRVDPTLVPDSVWVRGAIVLVSSLLLAGFAARAARGSRGAWRRVCLLSGIMTVAVVVVVSIPGLVPDWMKL